MGGIGRRLLGRWDWVIAGEMIDGIVVLLRYPLGIVVVSFPLTESDGILFSAAAHLVGAQHVNAFAHPMVNVNMGKFDGLVCLQQIVQHLPVRQTKLLGK